MVHSPLWHYTSHCKGKYILVDDNWEIVADLNGETIDWMTCKIETKKAGKRLHLFNRINDEMVCYFDPEVPQQ